MTPGSLYGVGAPAGGAPVGCWITTTGAGSFRKTCSTNGMSKAAPSEPPATIIATHVIFLLKVAWLACSRFANTRAALISPKVAAVCFMASCIPFIISKVWISL